ncbi:MAG: hypothetical protein IT439_02950 [Phycisphaerales bacterium]|nr:hypothetical protein [Phycisphaerales bacterium]
MLLVKGFALSIAGGVLAAAAWVGIIIATGWNAWLICPIVGGGAGLGMMLGTKMRGGMEAGLLAALSTLVCIGAARFIVITDALRDVTRANESDIIENLAWTVAEEWDAEGYEVMDDDDELLPAVHSEAERRWFMMTEAERRDALAAEQAEGDELAAAATPWAMLFDFGILGTVCACLTIGTAFKTGSITLEAALVQKGKASSPTEAAELAARLRAGERICEGPLAGPGPSRSRTASAPPARTAPAPRATVAPGEMTFKLPVAEPPKTARRAIMTAGDDEVRNVA